MKINEANDFKYWRLLLTSKMESNVFYIYSCGNLFQNPIYLSARLFKTIKAQELPQWSQTNGPSSPGSCLWEELVWNSTKKKAKAFTEMHLIVQYQGRGFCSNLFWAQLVTNFCLEAGGLTDLVTLSLASVTAGSTSEHDFHPLVSLEKRVGYLPPNKFAAFTLQWVIRVNPLARGKRSSGN